MSVAEPHDRASWEEAAQKALEAMERLELLLRARPPSERQGPRARLAMAVAVRLYHRARRICNLAVFGDEEGEEA